MSSSQGKATDQSLEETLCADRVQLTRSEMKNNFKDDSNSLPYQERDFEGGYGGQEDLEDRFATTSGEH